jgi:outer membrane protein assembly factor BamB
MFRGDAGVFYRSEGRANFIASSGFPTGDRIVSSPILKGDVIYFGDDGNVYAVNATDGHQIWKHRPAAQYHRRPRSRARRYT